MCRSITYDYGRRVCKLFKETRRSRPNMFKATTDHIDYFENKCVKGKFFLDQRTKLTCLPCPQTPPPVSTVPSPTDTFPTPTACSSPPRCPTVSVTVTRSPASTASLSTSTQSVASVFSPARTPPSSHCSTLWASPSLGRCCPLLLRRVPPRTYCSTTRTQSSARRATANKVWVVSRHNHNRSLRVGTNCLHLFLSTVSVQCNQQDMLLTLNFEAPFTGRVYTKANPAQCFVNGNGQTELQVSCGANRSICLINCAA